MSPSPAPSSATAARPLPPRPARSGGGRNHLEVVPEQVSRPGRLPFVLLIVLLLSVGLAALLSFNTALAQGSFTVRTLQTKAAEQSDRSQALEEEIARAAAPDRLARAARKIGMVPAPRVGHIRLGEGTVSGRPPVSAGAPLPLTPAQREQAEARQVADQRQAAERAQERAAADAAAAERRRVAAEQQRLAAQRAAEERAAAQAAATAERARQQWRDQLAGQSDAGPQGGGEQVVTPPDRDGG